MYPTPESIKRNYRSAMLHAGGIFLFLAVICFAAIPLSPVIIIGLAVSVLIAYAVYYFMTKQIKRRQALIKTPFPDEWEKVLHERVDYFNRLKLEERERFRRMVQIFLDEITIVDAGAGVDDEVLALVGASAVIPVFGFPEWEYGMLNEVIVRPNAFDATMNPKSGDPQFASGMVGDRGIFSGALILSKVDLLRDFELKHDKHNVGIHEFTHLVDKASGRVDGVPVSLPKECFRPWVNMVADIVKKEGRNKKNKDIPAYGFTNEEEFFAVVSEYFFECPEQMKKKHPELYELMQKIFRQDTSSLLKKTLTQSVRGFYR